MSSSGVLKGSTIKATHVKTNNSCLSRIVKMLARTIFSVQIPVLLKFMGTVFPHEVAFPFHQAIVCAI